MIMMIITIIVIIKNYVYVSWCDEAPMCNKYVFEAVDRSFKDIMKIENPAAENMLFGGKVIVIGGDFRQILPVIPHGTRTDIVASCLKKSHIWPNIDVRHLTINMIALLGSNENKQEQQEFIDYLLRIGEGTEKTIKSYVYNENMEEDLIEINNTMLSKSTNLDDFIDKVYPNLSHITHDTNYEIERTILAAKNEDVDAINEKILNKINGKEFVYYSAMKLLILIVINPNQTHII